MGDYKLIGHNYQTPDLVAKVTGRAKYAEDYRADGMLFVKLLLSPMPHARVRHVDASDALKLPGVHAILICSSCRMAAARPRPGSPEAYDVGSDDARLAPPRPLGRTSRDSILEVPPDEAAPRALKIVRVVAHPATWRQWVARGALSQDAEPEQSCQDEVNRHQ